MSANQLYTLALDACSWVVRNSHNIIIGWPAPSEHSYTLICIHDASLSVSVNCQNFGIIYANGSMQWLSAFFLIISVENAYIEILCPFLGVFYHSGGHFH